VACTCSEANLMDRAGEKCECLDCAASRARAQFAAFDGTPDHLPVARRSTSGARAAIRGAAELEGAPSGRRARASGSQAGALEPRSSVGPSAEILTPMAAQSNETVGSADAEECMWCWLLPPPLDVFCFVGCQGSDYTLVPTDGGGGGTPPSDCEYGDATCESFRYELAPSEVPLAGYTGTDYALDYADCAVLGSLNGYEVTADQAVQSAVSRGGLFFSVNDWLSELTPYASLVAPDDLTSRWSSKFPFDAPGYTWLYVNVGQGDRDAGGCELPSGVKLVNDRPSENEASYLVTALQSYACYSVLRTDGGDGCPSAVRVRYWVGLINHFSLFLDPRTQDSTATVPYGTGDLPSEIWDNASANVANRGTLAAWWTAISGGLSIGVGWEDPAAGSTTALAQFPCDPAKRPSAFRWGSAYQEADGTPAPMAFANPEVVDTGSSDFTSFLGQGVWGDACIHLEPGEILTRRKLLGGFRALFGGHVKFSYYLKYWATVDGLGAYGSSGGPPNELRLDICVRANDLAKLEDVVAAVESARSTPEGNWVFRVTDANSLSAASKAGTKGKDAAKKCSTC